jgi:hypothetical protein
MKTKCDCLTFYLLGGSPKCLHKLFESGGVKIITKETTPNGAEFYIFADKPKDKSQAWKRGWWRSGRRSRIRSKDQVILAIQLAKKHQTRRVIIEYGKVIKT